MYNTARNTQGNTITTTSATVPLLASTI